MWVWVYLPTANLHLPQCWHYCVWKGLIPIGWETPEKLPWNLLLTGSLFELLTEPDNHIRHYFSGRGNTANWIEVQCILVWTTFEINMVIFSSLDQRLQNISQQLVGRARVLLLPFESPPSIYLYSWSQGLGGRKVKPTKNRWFS